MKTIYDEDTISKQYEILLQQMREGQKLEPVDMQFGVSAGHALDALGLARDVDHPLDLNDMSEENINAAVIAVYLYFSRKGESSTACRQKLSKKIGSYLLFTVCNEVNKRDDLTAELVSKGDMLYCRVKDSEQNVHFIDVLGITESFMRNNLKYDKNAGVIVITDPTALTGKLKSQIAML